MDSKDDAKVAEAAAGVEKLSLSKKKKFKFVKVDPKELNIVIDDGRGRDTDFRNNNKPNHVKSQESRKSSSHHPDKGSGSSGRHSGSSGGGATSRNMSRGSSKHTPASSNYKADFELFMGLGLDGTPTKKPLVYPIQTFNMDIDDMTSREIFVDVYADIRTHQMTYQDKQLISCFYNSIINESHLFKDKIVLEVGCGMGLLSLFCAEAGAKHVISVDCSVITQLAQEIVEDNDLDDVITVIQSRMEDIVKLPHGIKKVDIIVSNWMGHSLYLDSIVNAVLYARERFLRPGGLILPDRAEMYCAVANDSIPTAKYSFWYDVYGFSMEPIQRDWPNLAKFHTVLSDQIMSDSVLIHSIDLNTCKVSDTSFNLEFTLEANKAGFVNSFILYFKTYFLDSTYVLDTSPHLPSTHWGQTVLFIDRSIRIHEGASLLCNLQLIRLRDKQNSVQCNMSMDFLGYPDNFFEKKYILSFY